MVLKPDTRKSKGLNILLVEDNKLNQKFACALLAQAGHEVSIAEHGKIALDMISVNTYDVVLMDVQMPVMDGLQATKLVREMAAPKCQVPIIMLTANAMAGAREQYIAAGADDYVAKPISVDVLLGKLSSIASPQTVLVHDAETGEGMNWELVHATQRVFSPTAFRTFIDDHVADTASRIAAMREALQEGRLQDIIGDAHALVSTAGNVGSMRVSELARSIEQHAQAGNATQLESLLPELQRAAEGAARRLQGFNTDPGNAAQGMSL